AESRASSRLALLHEEGEFGSVRVREQLVAGLLAERLEVLHRARIGRHDLEHLARRKVAQHLFRAKDGQWAVESADVELSVGLHHHFGVSGSEILTCGHIAADQGLTSRA